MRYLIAIFLLLPIGCGDDAVTERKRRPRPIENVGEFKGDKEVVTPTVVYTNPITGPLEAYEPMKQQISQLGIKKAVDLFHASEGRYPKDHAEFMQRVIKENNIRLPKLGKEFDFEYDVDNHELLIVKADPAAKE